MDKSGEKSPPKRRGRPENLIPGAGRGPAKGAPNAGRPPNWWKEKMDELRDRWLVAAEAHGVVDNPDHPDWARVGRFLHEARAGKPAQAVDVTSNGNELQALTWKIGDREVTF